MTPRLYTVVPVQFNGRPLEFAQVLLLRLKPGYFKGQPLYMIPRLYYLVESSCAKGGRANKPAPEDLPVLMLSFGSWEQDVPR